MLFTMVQYILLLILFAIARPLARANSLSNCYLPDGTALPFSRAYEPCVQTAGVVSMCCVLNTTALEALGETASQVDVCRQDGLCQTYIENVYARDACTDPTWTSPNCQTACTGGNTGGGSADDTSLMTQCTDGSWCCGKLNTTCCNNDEGFKIADKIGPYTTSVSSITTSSSTALSTISTGVTTSSGTSTGTGASQNTPTGTSQPTSKSTSSHGLAIGLGVGLGVVAVALAGVGVFIWWKRRKAAAKKNDYMAKLPETKSRYPTAGAQKVENQQYRAYQPVPGHGGPLAELEVRPAELGNYK